MTESSKQRPHREWWITVYPDSLDIPDRVGSKKPPGIDILNNPNKYFHVIEASYAKELEAKLAVAVKALELWTQPVPEVGECLDEHEAINRVFNSVRLRQKEALEQLKKAGKV